MKGKCQRYRSADLDLVFCPRRESWQGNGKRNGPSVGMIWREIMPCLLGAFSKGCLQGGGLRDEHAGGSRVEEKGWGSIHTVTTQGASTVPPSPLG